MVQKLFTPVAARLAKHNISSEPDEWETSRNAGNQPGTQAQPPQVLAWHRILAGEAALKEPCCVCTYKADCMDGVPATQYVNIGGQGTTYIRGMVTGKNSCQVVNVNSNATAVISGLEAGEGSTQLICVSDNEDSLRDILAIALAPRRSIREGPKHLQPSQLPGYLDDILHLSVSRGTAPVFGGLEYREDRWECFLFDQYFGAKGALVSSRCHRLLHQAKVDLETFICLEIFASLLAQCAEYEGQTTLCPNWLWAKQKAIFGSKPSQPQATLQNLLSLIRNAPTCPVRIGSWATSCCVEMWHLAQRERRQTGIEQDIRTIRAVKGCFLDEEAEMYI